MLGTETGHPVGPTANETTGRAAERLVRAVRDLAQAREIADIVEVVRHAARELVAADGATFVLRDGDQCYYVDEDAIEPLWRGQRFPLTACVSGWSMQHGEAAVIPDIYTDDRIPQDAYRRTFVRSLAMTPIRASGSHGAIGTYWAEEHLTTTQEVELLQALADSTAVALDSVLARQELEAKVADRTRELSAANADLAAFAHLAAHDLKVPLTTIVGFAEIAADVDGERLSPAGVRALEAVQRQAGRMSTLVDDILGYSTAATATLDLAPVDFAQLVAEVVEDIEAMTVQHGGEITVADLPVGFGSAHLLKRVLQNLIVNGLVYGDPDRPRVEVSGTVAEGRVRIMVTDNGSGVGPDDRERIFDMFVRGSVSSAAAGSGIGLAFARRVVSRHGGTLGVEDGPDGGARFTIELPARGGRDRGSQPARPRA